MPQHLPDSLRHDSLATEGFSKPITKLALIVTLCHIRVPVQFKFDCTDRFIIRLQADSIGLRTVKDIPDDIQTFLYALVRRPSDDRADVRILCI